MVQSWFNADGLQVRFGPDAFGPTVGGEFKTYGPLRTVEFKLDLTTLTSTSVPVDDAIFFPKSVFVESVEIDVQTAATSGGAPTLDVGLIQTDRSTITSNTSFINALALASINTAGQKIIFTTGTTSAGGAIGTTPSQVNYISARANAATYTAGVVIVRINYRRTL